ncbi:hypothetical protein AVEN_130427-1 [Araneus ventricosus]|uniref:Uncharacterized protein n=1 Tax=Araneus ventricosus TaxID=182803 RepID=A0A4Y2NC52_ARAVE|nr:hypothetical protein AVEN_130427-1 [Araneus ventricosus]
MAVFQNLVMGGTSFPSAGLFMVVVHWVTTEWNFPAATFYQKKQDFRDGQNHELQYPVISQATIAVLLDPRPEGGPELPAWFPLSCAVVLSWKNCFGLSK